MSETNKAVLRRWFEEVWNKGRTDVIDELLARDAIIHGLEDANGQPVEGYAAYENFHRQFRGAFPNIAVSIDDMVAEGDKVAARCGVAAKHTGNTLGFEATHSDVEFDGMTFVVIKDGKITEAWNNFDFMRMNKQLGLM
jgi:steroid delta-isomerase-like uncharacterized protein